MRELEVFVNDPFEASKLKDLFVTREDLQLASPNTVWPFSETEWSETFSKHPENCSLLFYIEGTLIGHTSFLPRDEDLYLCYVILHPEFRGQGYAEQMITLSEEFCRLNYPHEEIHLNVSKGNDRAYKLYEKSGYVEYKEEETKFKMKKRL